MEYTTGWVASFSLFVCGVRAGESDAMRRVFTGDVTLRSCKSSNFDTTIGVE